MGDEPAAALLAVDAAFGLQRQQRILERDTGRGKQLAQFALRWQLHARSEHVAVDLVLQRLADMADMGRGALAHRIQD
ncbi:hypothetical protein D3C80_2124640 [compost metagenome]